MNLVPTAPSWVAAALADLPALLVDHAHCERKAASTALRWVGKYPEWPRLATRLSRLAREELVHHERVLAELAARGLAFRTQLSAQYGALLFAAARPPSPGPAFALGDRSVDEMLVCALIEARSHERFARLAEVVPDARLADLYQDLLEAEARHGELYLDLAREAAGGDVDDRLAVLCAHEAEVVARSQQPVRMHAGG